jgi:hypothetical protein
VTATLDELHQQINREVREANLRTEKPTEIDILHRRLQIAFVGAVVVIGLLVTTLANDLWASVRQQAWIDPQVARVALLVFTGWIAFYLWEKERHLKRVTKLSGEIARLDQDLAGNLLRSALVLDSVEAVHTSLELDVVVRRVVDQARWLLGASSSVLHFPDEDGTLVPGESRSDDAAQPVELAGLAELVGSERSAVQLSRDGHAVVCAPMRAADGTLIAVISVSSERPDAFSAESRALLERFAASATAAIENARRYEAAVFLLDVQSADPADFV